MSTCQFLLAKDAAVMVHIVELEIPVSQTGWGIMTFFCLKGAYKPQKKARTHCEEPYIPIRIKQTLGFGKVV